MGYTANFASELEFYLFDEDYRSVHEKGYRNLVTTGYYIEDYHIFQTSKEEGVMRAIRNHLQASAIPVENSKGEWGPGQEEINICYADALSMADRHVILKNAIKEIAHANGKAVTFMAKWNYALAGSSCHIHMSLADRDGIPAFYDPHAEHGMSQLMRPRYHLVSCALRQFLQALPGWHLRSHQDGLEPRQSHRRFSALRGEHKIGQGRVPDRRSRPQPLSGVRRAACSRHKGD
jgi:hypothetical protein